MARPEAEQLKKIIDDARQKPIWGQGAFAVSQTGITPSAKLSRRGASTEDIATWIAMREVDRNYLKTVHPDWSRDRQYRADSLPDRISQAYADLLYGEPPIFTAPGGSDDEPGPDQENLDELIKENNLPSELKRMTADCSAEGEQWWRIYTDPEESDYPILEFNSRLDVIPLFRGRKLLAAAFVSVLYTQEIEIAEQVETEVWRKIEIVTDGLSQNFLYKGSTNGLGIEHPLADRPETSGMMEEWDHGLEEMLAGRIPNKLGRDFRLGISDYQGIRDQLFDLNEARSIMAENARLAAKKRAVAQRKLVNQETGKIDLGSDILLHDDEGTDAELGRNDRQTDLLQILEYTFDATALIAHIRELVGTAVTRVGLVEQFVNTSSSTDGGGNGASETGVALRTRLIPTTLSANGKAQFQDEEIPKMIRCLQLVDALPAGEGGCGHEWVNADEAPLFERSSILPEDEDDAVNRHVAAVGGEIESIYTAVKERHPKWDDQEIKEEIQRIHDDRNGGTMAGPNDEADTGGDNSSGTGSDEGDGSDA